MRPSQTKVIRVVVVGGLDPGGGAGLLRDVATAAARGARAHAVGTAWTVQSQHLHRVEPREPRAVREALGEAVAGGPGAIKIGMAVGPATAGEILEALAAFRGPVVLDPVLATSRGGALWNGAPGELLPLGRRATLVTPNAAEAAALTGRSVSTAAEAEAAGLQLLEEEGLAAVLVKGGHLDEQATQVIDVLVTREGRWRLSRPRIAGPSPRGTGCALATAIAVELAGGQALPEAVAAAGAWLGGSIGGAVERDGERHLP